MTPSVFGLGDCFGSLPLVSNHSISAKSCIRPDVRCALFAANAAVYSLFPVAALEELRFPIELGMTAMLPFQQPLRHIFPIQP